MSRTDADVERRVAERLRQGDVREAASLAIGSFGPDILGYLTAVLRDADDAADAFSLFCEDVWKGLAQFRAECALKTWVYKLAWNAAMRFSRDLFRQRGRRLRTSEISHIAQQVLTSAPAHLHESATENLDRLRQRLTPEEQTLLILRIDRKLPWNEVAVILSTDAELVDGQAVRKRFERLKARLRALAEEEGLIDR